MSVDGIWRRCHPIFAVFIGDYPEQGLVTCTYNGRCPKCLVSRDQIGEFRSFPLRTTSDAMKTYCLADEEVHVFHRACREAGVKPVFHPFWESLPFADIFQSITPDILHQLLQGVAKHVIAWLTSPTVFGSVAINARCRSLPPNHHIRLFANGITTLSRVSGQEHKNMCSILLGLVVDLPLPGGQVPSRVIKAVRALLDFIYLAKFSSHTSETLHHLQDSLARFHDNKAVFVDLGTRENFNLPKLHALLHYRPSILLFGTTDNYSTEQTERLHIDFTKNAYRATNHKGEYLQMTTWLERREKVQRHAVFIKQEQDGHREPGTQTELVMPIGPLKAHNGYLRMVQHPTVKAVLFDDLVRKYGAIDFPDALGDFIAHMNHPGASTTALHAHAADTLIPFRAVPVFHRIRFVASADCENSGTVDAVNATPERIDLHRHVVPSRFDTVLVRNGQDRARANKGKFSYQT
jgi:hypothetical protein